MNDDRSARLLSNRSIKSKKPPIRITACPMGVGRHFPSGRLTPVCRMPASTIGDVFEKLKKRHMATVYPLNGGLHVRYTTLIWFISISIAAFMLE
ncbi:hypothetical protein VSX61_08900 [Brenneria populi subsp. brevivirga]|uniref:hypothetical protein n=1 Tax=Brenneria populi TaxID=1505588 RepID=UPI002E197828|nr:hypothetical protein [Brenneria populi subsp. brevivirga]